MAYFSVVVPLFNKAEFVVDTVTSILTQTIRDLEVVVIDDGSTDDGVQRLTLITDPRLRVIRQANGGVSVARNAGIAQARGEFICFLDADDLWTREHLSTVQGLIMKDPTAIAWATGYSEIDQHQSVHGSMRQSSHFVAGSGRYDQSDFMLAWSHFPFFWTGSITVRSSVLNALQPCFPPAERLGEDQDLWFRLSELGSIQFSPVRTTAFYRRNVSDSLTTAQVMAPLPSFLRLRQRAEKLPQSAKNAAHQLCGVHLLHVAWINCLAGRKISVLRLLLQVNPSIRWGYWLRILFCNLLPARLLRAGLIYIRKFGVS